VKGTYGEEVWKECEAIAQGRDRRPETLVVVYAADPDDDWTKPETWAKGNPNLGVSVKLESLAAECRRAQQLPRLENDFKRYRLNMWTDQATAGCRSTGWTTRAAGSAGTIASGPVGWRTWRRSCATSAASAASTSRP
jgi:phage terminase large subunit-like protein